MRSEHQGDAVERGLPGKVPGKRLPAGNRAIVPNGPLRAKQALSQAHETTGNRAVARLMRSQRYGRGARLAPMSPGTQVLQRYESLRVSWGEQEKVVYDIRRHAASGFASPANRGWIRICDGKGNLERHDAVSQPERRHTEELLLCWALTRLCAQDDADLAVVAPRDPSAEPRIFDLYTEREPCRADNTDHWRAGRHYGNCHTQLSACLHKETPVYWSVSKDEHTELMLKFAARSQRDRCLEELEHAYRRAPRSPGLDAIYRDAREGVASRPAPTSQQMFGAWCRGLRLFVNKSIKEMNA